MRSTVYPRVCGGTDVAEVELAHQYGLSPRVRGNLTVGFTAVQWLRSIPACAGEPPGQSARPSLSPVYPRVCGGIGLVIHHEASDGNGLVYCHTAPDHRLEGPGPTAEVTGP